LVALIQRLDSRHLLAARHAPGRPEIEEYHFATQFSQAERSTRRRGQGEIWRRWVLPHRRGGRRPPCGSLLRQARLGVPAGGDHTQRDYKSQRELPPIPKLPSAIHGILHKSL